MLNSVVSCLLLFVALVLTRVLSQPHSKSGIGSDSIRQHRQSTSDNRGDSSPILGYLMDEKRMPFVGHFVRLLSRMMELLPLPKSNSTTSMRAEEVDKFHSSVAMDDPAIVMFHSEDVPRRKQPVNSHPIGDEKWVQTLFGPRGILTEVFQVIDNKKTSKQSDIASPAQSIDFGKIFNGLVENSQVGKFSEPLIPDDLPELLGLCNRLSCGDIYKAIDEFRKSEFFTNFQTAIHLIQDPEGWKILGDLISNPELIATFTGGGGSEKELIKKGNNKKTVIDETEFGIDFDKEPDKLVKGNTREQPEIAENIDEDYYNQIKTGKEGKEEEGETVEYGETIDKTDETLGKTEETTGKTDETIEKTDETIGKTDETIGKTEETIGKTEETIGKTDETIDKTDETIDKTDETIDKTDETIDKTDETVQLPDIAESIDESQWIKSVIDERMPDDVSNSTRTIEISHSTRTIAISNPTRTISIPHSTSTITSSKTITTITTQPQRSSTPRNTSIPTRNFRRDNDYYAMYYDNNN